MSSNGSGPKANELSALCKSCGLCCDGTLFERVELEPDEPALFAVDALLRQRGTQFLSLPCPEHRAGCCSVYERRPVTCAQFTCKLYDSVTGSKTTDVEARERVEHVKALRDLIAQLLGWPARRFSTARFKQWASEFPGGEAQARRLHSVAFLKYGLLRLSLNQYFMPDVSSSQGEQK